MSEHCGYVVKVEKLRPHTNADKLQIATFFGNDTCVSLDTELNEIGIYFPSDLQLSEEFCVENHLCRKKPDGTPDTGYLEPDKRNIKAIKLRGEKSDGIFMPLSCLVYTGVNLSDINVGDTITVVNGHEICKKYIPRGRNRNNSAKGKGNKTRKKHAPVAPLFTEHADTEQLAYNLGAFKPGDEIEITLKMHGTSQRTAYVPVLKGYKRTIWDKIFKREGTPIYDWDYVSGTRRTVLDDWDGGFYGSNAFRKQHHDKFVGKLRKGEEIYYEVVGFTDNGTSIMGKGNNKKLGKDFVKQYGEETVFSYGCSPDGLGEPVEYWDEAKTQPAFCPIVPQSDLYVYRMTMTNEDGDVVEYTPDFMRYRCEQMGVKCVPMLWRGFIPADESLEEGYDCYGEYGTWRVCREGTPGEWIKNIAEQYYDGPDPIGKTHVREGVVVRVINRPKFCAYKHKNYSFKMLEGLIKETAEAPDMEEVEDEINNEEDT
jgi:hypothetical protein